MDTLYLLSLRSALRDTLAMPEHEREAHLRGIIADLTKRIEESEAIQAELAMVGGPLLPPRGFNDPMDLLEPEDMGGLPQADERLNWRGTP